MKVAVLGGGVAGVSVAIFLDPAFDVSILEAAPRAGGLARSHQYQGFFYDAGPHILFSRDTATLDWMLDCDRANLLARARSNQIWYKGRLIPYPFENHLALLPPDETARCVRSLSENPHASRQPANMLEFFETTFGAGITETYLRPYNEKIWKYSPARMDLQMVERIPRPPLEDVLAGARGEFRTGYTHQAVFYYPRHGGVQSFFDALCRRLPPKARLITSRPVRRVQRGAGAWLIDGERFDRIINCLPLHELLPCLEPAPPGDIAAALARLEFNSLHYGVVLFRADNAGENFSLNFPDPAIAFHRVSKLNFLQPGTPSAFLFEITFRDGTPQAAWSSTKLQEAVLDGFEAASLARKGDCLGFESRRLRYAYPIYTLPHSAARETVLGWLESHDIHSCGRFAEFLYLNMDQVIARARTLAARLNEAWA